MTEDVAMKMKSAYKKDSFTPEEKEKLRNLANAKDKVKPGEKEDYMDAIRKASGNKIKNIKFGDRIYS
jgi:exonuclease III